MAIPGNHDDGVGHRLEQLFGGLRVDRVRHVRPDAIIFEVRAKVAWLARSITDPTRPSTLPGTRTTRRIEPGTRWWLTLPGTSSPRALSPRRSVTTSSPV